MSFEQFVNPQRDSWLTAETACDFFLVFYPERLFSFFNRPAIVAYNGIIILPA
jgi:hypothetical protein